MVHHGTFYVQGHVHLSSLTNHLRSAGAKGLLSEPASMDAPVTEFHCWTWMLIVIKMMKTRYQQNLDDQMINRFPDNMSPAGLVWYDPSILLCSDWFLDTFSSALRRRNCWGPQLLFSGSLQNRSTGRPFLGSFNSTQSVLFRPVADPSVEKVLSSVHSAAAPFCRHLRLQVCSVQWQACFDWLKHTRVLRILLVKPFPPQNCKYIRSLDYVGFSDINIATE